MVSPMVKDIKEELEKGKRYHAASKEEKKILDNKLFKENKPTDNSSKDFIDDFVESLGEILKIIKKDQSVTINENKSGIYINMTLLQEDILQEIGGYVAYVEQQETILNSTESQKDELNNNFFV